MLFFEQLRPQRCTPARSHIMFYVLAARQHQVVKPSWRLRVGHGQGHGQATIAAVVLYVVGIMPNKATEAQMNGDMNYGGWNKSESPLENAGLSHYLEGFNHPR